MPDDSRIILTFGKPPDDAGFALSKSGKTWWRKADSIDEASQIAEQLVGLGIHGVIKKSRPNVGRGRYARSQAVAKKYGSP